MSYVSVAMRRLCSAKAALGLGAVLLVGLVLAATLNPWKASAEPPTDCPNTFNVQFLLWPGKCTFTNLAVHPVNDIHVVFDGLVISIETDPNATCRRQFPVIESGHLVLKTVFNCRIGQGLRGGSIEPFGTFSMLVLHFFDQHPQSAHIVSWYWTLNGTPVTITPTGTATPTDTPTPSPAETPTPGR